MQRWIVQQLLFLVFLFLQTVVPVSSIIGGLPVSKQTDDDGSISHHVLVESIGGVNDRKYYKSHSSFNVSQSNCTGILLKPDFVLLPARCVSDMTTPGEPKLHPSAIKVKHSCGIHTPWSVSGKLNCKQVNVAAVFIHPCWRTRVPNGKGGTDLNVLGDHDVAVLRLESSIQSIGSKQRYAVLDDGATIATASSSSSSSGSTATQTHTDVGTVLTFRGYGPHDTSGTKSAAMRETQVKIAPASNCVQKFDIVISRTEAPGSSVASTSNDQRLSTKTVSTKSLNFKDRQICVGDDGLTNYALSGGCPNGDLGGPLETANGVLGKIVF
jgi:hypothetical protein